MTERNTINNALRALLAIITATDKHYGLFNQSISDKEKKSLMRLTPARFKKLETLFALKLGEKDGVITAVLHSVGMKHRSLALASENACT